MSLLFDHAIATYDFDSSELYSPDEGELATDYDSVSLDPVIEFASKQPELVMDDEPYVILPLHQSDSASLSHSHVLYKEDSVRGDIIIYDVGGEREYTDVSTFAATAVCQRLRYWHSDNQPPELPPGYDLPVDDNESPRRSMPPSVLTDQLEQFIENERKAVRDANREQAMRQPPAELYRDGGDAIPSITVDDIQGGTVQLEVSLPASCRTDRGDDWSYYVPSEFGIYEGNEVLLHGDKDAPVLEAEVVNIHGLTLRAEIDWGSAESPSSARRWLKGSPESLGVSQLLNPVPTRRESEAVDTLAAHPIFDILAGQRSITFTNGAAAQTEQFDQDLNQSQALAAELALLADDIFCIHGPPGTGKTRTLVEIIRRAAAADERVLVVADSNQAVDNMVIGESTAATADSTSLHAYGQHGADEFVLRRVNASRSDHDLVERAYGEQTGSADVVAATNNSAAALPDHAFDTVVIDEATQTTCTASCIPLSKASRAILAGDHHQLPPFSAHDEPPDSDFGLSLFEHLYAEGGVFEGVGIRLKTQYRMTPEVAYFSNREFYERDLRAGQTVETLDAKPHALEGYSVGGTVESVGHSYANPTEAALVAHIVDDLLSELPPDDIGIITPYAGQIDEIHSALAERTGIDNPDRLVVDTIDSFQGSEREAIVISLVRSNGDGRLGFLGRHPDGPRRLNVALTRARRYCAVIGDFHTVRYESAHKRNDFYNRFYRHFDDTGRLRHVDPALLSTS